MGILKVKPKPASAPALTVKDKSQTALPPRAAAPVARELQADIKAQQAIQQIPESNELETALLGAIFTNPSAGFPIFQRFARHGFFFNDINRTLYTLAKKFYDDNGRLDLIGFTAYLGDMPRFPQKLENNQGRMLDWVGGAYAITHLFTGPLGTGYSANMIEYYLDQLKERYLRRQIMVRCSMLVRAASEGKNLDDLLAIGQRSIHDLQKVASGHRLEDAVNYTNGKCPEMPKEIVYHILHQGSKMIVGGTSKGRKTMALIDLAVSTCTGSEWWGFHTRKGAICYINFEIQDPFFWYRVNEVCTAKGIQIPAGMFYAWNLRGRAEGLERLRNEILTVLKGQKFVLTIIDPIYKALGDRDENKAGDVAGMLNEVEKIAVETGSAVAFGAHYSKGNQAAKESMDRIGGSGVFARDPDTILTMTAHEIEECFVVEGTLRNFPPMHPFVVKWDWPLFTRAAGNPSELKQPKNAGQFSAKFTPEMIVDELAVQAGTKITPLRRKLDTRFGMSKATFYRLVQQLIKEGLVNQVEDELFKV